VVFNREQFLREAVQIPSHDDVTEMRQYLVETLERAGQNSSVGDAGTVTASRGNSGGTHLVLNTHIDTVGPYVPYERDGDTVRGRGACDAKGPLAALLDAFLSASVGDGRLTLAVSPDEETAQFGGEHLAATLSADGYIVGEPTGLDVCHAARGSFGGRVTPQGESAHASDPDAGTNPLRAIGQLIAALEQYDVDHGPDEHPVLGAATLTPTSVESGGPLNQIPSSCTSGFDRRTVPPETADGFFAELESYSMLDSNSRSPSNQHSRTAPTQRDSPPTRRQNSSRH